MGSSEMVDSSRVSGGRSNFSQTCSLLSRYLKEKGSFRDIGLSFGQKSDPIGAPTETMNLLPMIEKSGSRNTHTPQTIFPQNAAGGEETQMKSDLSDAKPEAAIAQMTIFYAGKVIVFNDFPENKAKEIMMLASKSCAAPNHPNAAAGEEPAAGIRSAAPSFGIQDRPLRPAQPPLDSDLPIARKNSLARFLEKRKDRVTANAPYPANKATPAPKTVKTEEWLGLSPQRSFQIPRH